MGVMLKFGAPVVRSFIGIELRLLCLFKYVSSAVVIYLMAHTLLSSSMFWCFSKEYQMRRTRSFYHFNNYGDSWLTYIWLGLPVFITFVIELHLFEKLFYFELRSSTLFFGLMVYFIIVALMMCHNSVSSDSVADSERLLCYWLSYVLVSWLVLMMWFSI